MVSSGGLSETVVVPSYPYNVSIPLPQNGVTPDDSGINTHLPSICVDYLSHEWSESDVWASWKAMTRHKAEIANGVRLENASWRTWAKQRGKLKTISPETLNWLKDSDVTWLYGPLHTGIEAVPPPKVATASERLGLEPLRSLSDARREDQAATAATSKTSTKAVEKKAKKPAFKTKPILKYRSLSDILMPVLSPASPILEAHGMNFDYADPTAPLSNSTVLTSRSESNLWRLNSAARRKRNSSASPRGTSPDTSLGAHASDSSSSRNGDRRHISFNHRVEQCIAVDSTEEVKKYSGGGHSAMNGSSSEDDGDDEDDVLTFRSSPRVASFGPSAMSAAHSKHSADRSEPHTIARLGPTTLKSTEMYPAPSPVVVYQTGPPMSHYPNPVATNMQPKSQVVGATGGRRGMYDYNANGGLHSQWDPDEEDDYAMGFDYFSGGPDVGMGDEYDMVQYGSQHLIGTSHNHYQGGNTPSYHSSSVYGGPYNASGSPSHSNSSSTASTDSSPNHSRRSSGNASPTSPSSPPSVLKGPHSPATSSKDAASPKRSILKGSIRSREPSVEQPIPVGGGSSLLSTGSSTFASPPGSGRASPVSSSPQIGSRPSVRRTLSEEVFKERESRGRSASRGSSSSLERSASADRRSSISPSSSYTSMGGVQARPIGIPISRSRGGSSDSLNNLVVAGAVVQTMPDLPEASSESETETVKATVDDLPVSQSPDLPTVTPSPSSSRSTDEKDELSNSGEIEIVENAELPEDLHHPAPAVRRPSNVQNSRPPNLPIPTLVETAPSPSTSTIPLPPVPAPAPVAPEVAPVPSPVPPVASPTASPVPAPRYRQPSPSSPSAATTSTTTAKPQRGTESPSLPHDSPSIDPADAQWADDQAVPSHARRSLLRAARASSLGGSGSERDDSSSRASVESGRSGHDDYGFGLYDDEADSGIVGTARDLLGAITKGIWNMGRR